MLIVIAKSLTTRCFAPNAERKSRPLPHRRCCILPPASARIAATTFRQTLSSAPWCGARLEAGDDAALTTAVGSEPESVPNPVCPHCGAPLMDGAEFCTQCGSKVDASDVSQTEGEIETRALTSEQLDVDTEQYRADAAAAHESLNTVTPDLGMAGPVPVDKTALMPKPVSASGEGGGPVSPESLADKVRAGANAPKKKDPRKSLLSWRALLSRSPWSVAVPGRLSTISISSKKLPSRRNGRRKRLSQAEHVLLSR